ncbi:DNA break repair nuclease [Gryganskiella cystojenkinii]|nr:DNA break repair nuclease [Gryganskiella cystojenkinii]
MDTRRSTRSRITDDDPDNPTTSPTSRKHVLVEPIHLSSASGPNLKKPRPGLVRPPPPTASRRSLRRPQSLGSTPENDKNNSSTYSTDCTNSNTHVPITEQYPSPPATSNQSPQESPEENQSTYSSLSPSEETPPALGHQTNNPQEASTEFFDITETSKETDDEVHQTEMLLQSAHLQNLSTLQSNTEQRQRQQQQQDDGTSGQAQISSAVVTIETSFVPVEALELTIEPALNDNVDPDCNEGQQQVEEDNDIDLQDCDELDLDEIEGWDDFEEEVLLKQPIVPDIACPVCGIDLSTLDTMTPDAHVNRCLDSPPPPAPEAAEATAFEQQSTIGSTVSSIVGTIRSVISNIPSIPSSIRADSPPQFAPVKQVVPKKSEWQPRTKVSRPCPFYKKMPDTSFTVDAFCYGAVEECEAYFLTHFHSDHYGGLTSSWSQGPIYCSSITANLVESRLRVNPKYIKRLPMYVPTVVQGITVRLMDANHCPGSVLFVFDLESPKRRYLHTGDFRANPGMSIDPILCQPPNVPIDILYLDTTYSNPRYTFPPQDVVIRETARLICKEVGVRYDEDNLPAAATAAAPEPPMPVVQKKVNIMERWLKKESGNSEKLLALSVKTSQAQKAKEKWQEPEEKSKIVICVGTYLIGKERVWMAIAKAINSKVFVQPSKFEILSCLEDQELLGMLTSNPLDAQVHLMHMGQDMNQAGLQDYLDTLAPTFTRLIAVRPTGWTFTGSKKMTAADSDAFDAPAAPDPTSSSSCSTLLEFRPSFASETIKIYPVPYSEHSSFNELAGFVRSLNILKVIPTVGVGSEKGRHAMNEWFRRWEDERRQGIGWI